MKILYKTITGSRLYNLHTESSDTDFKGFGLPDVSKIIGMARQEQDESKSLDDNTEGMVFSLNKYFHLLMKGNPTVFEIAFAEPKYHLVLTELGNEVLDFVKKTFTTKHVFKPYNAYFRAQRHELNNTVRVGKRLDLVRKYGYDIKFASHALRLGYQCIEVMSTGNLNPTMIGIPRDNCFLCKTGQLTKSEVDSLLDTLDKEMYHAYKTSSLPEKPSYDEADKFLIKIYYEHIKDELCKL